MSRIVPWSLSPALYVGGVAVSIDEAKGHLLIKGTQWDSRISAKLPGAVGFCQAAMGRSLLTQTFVQSIPEWPKRIVLYAAPAIAITSITYLDVNGVSQVLDPSNYNLSVVNDMGIVEYTNAAVLPTLTNDKRIDRVTVTFTAGYGATTADVPETLRAAVLWRLEHTLEQTSPVIIGAVSSELPQGIDSVLDQYKIHYPAMEPRR